MYKTQKDVYHFITRDDDVMNIVETQYDLIDLDSIELIKSDGKTYSFKDKLHNYKFYKSKSVLLEEFDASQEEIIAQIPIEQFDDPFELISMIELPSERNEEIYTDSSILGEDTVSQGVVAEGVNSFVKIIQKQQKIYQEIYLPLYQDTKEGRDVSPRSGINIRHSKSKNKGSNTLRPEYEIEVRVSKWIHHIFPGFFGINAMDEDEIRDEEKNDFDLILPDGRVLRGRIKQQGGKSLQTNPQGALGEWILKDVLGSTNREIIDEKWLDALGIDTLKVVKIDDKHFKITVAETGAYEQFKLDNRNAMEEVGLNGRQLPYFTEGFLK